MMNHLRDELKQPRGRVALTALVVLGLLWSGITAADWYMRFHWFQWQRSFVSGPLKPRYMGDAAPWSTNRVAPSVGGDLSALLGLPAAKARFAVPRTNAYEIVMDEFGFPNQPPTTNQIYPVVLAGDSYMLQGRGMDRLPGARLSQILQQPVYTLAYAGRGAVFALGAYLEHPNFRARPPKVLVWGVIERDVSGYFFDSMSFTIANFMAQTNRSVATNTSGSPAARIQWPQLSASRLRTSLPNTSIAAQLTRRFWTKFRYAVWGALSPDVLESVGPVAGQPMLFYKDSINALNWSPEIRDVPGMSAAAAYRQHDYFRPRGVEWIILLIPDKEQVYREYLPASAQQSGREIPESCFAALEDALRAEGIRVVNLLPAFRAAAARGELLYWPDDTHWNDRGVEIASQEIAKEVLAAQARGVP
jgi:hypothetical protein